MGRSFGLWTERAGQIALIGYFYGDKEEIVSPSIIGEKCFDKILEDAKKNEV